MSKNNQILALAIIVISGLILSVTLLNEHKLDIHDFHTKSTELKAIPQDIKYYDEVLTMSSYMAALTHETKWIERYDEAEVSILSTISKAIKQFPNIQESIDEIDKLGAILIDLERRSFKLLEEGRFQEAEEILFDDNYDFHKKRYVNTLDKIVKRIELSIEEYESKTEADFERLLFIISLVLLSVIVLGGVIYSIFSRQNRELRASEESLDNQYRLLEKIIDSVPMRMFWKDKDGVYLGANQSFVDDAELNDRSQIIGKTDFDMTWSKDAQKFIDDDRAVTDSGIPRLNYEEDQPKEDGSVIHLLTSKVPLRDIHNNIIGILGIYSDITEQKKLERLKEEQDEQLFKQAKHAQMGEMIAMIAHQWRQPLASISATVSSLQVSQELQGYDKEYFNEELDNISEYTQHLSKTIDDFRDFFKDEKEKIPTSLISIIDDSLSIIGSIIKSKGIQINIKFLSDEKLLTYPNELKQVVLNILKNAQEVIEEKKIKVPAISIKTFKHENIYYIQIKDNAGGIPNDIIDKIFEPYFTTKSELNGTGLGLYMSKIIVEEHMHGKLHVDNVDDGACFTIELNEDF